MLLVVLVAGRQPQDHINLYHNNLNTFMCYHIMYIPNEIGKINYFM